MRFILLLVLLFKDYFVDDLFLKYNFLKYYNLKFLLVSDLIGEEEIVKFKERKKLFVLGGNGFVGLYVCMEVFVRGVFVVSFN